MKRLLVSLAAMVAISASAQSYVIQPGETVFGIANRHGVTYNQLMKANPGLDPDYIKAGFRIEIPEPVKAVNASKPVVHPASQRVTQKTQQNVQVSQVQQGQRVIRVQQPQNPTRYVQPYATQYTTPTGLTTITIVEHDGATY